jgi:protein-L-isoaspartate(D-aspartate) O-methyltransferase
MSRFNQPAATEHKGVFDYVLQFPHVAGEIMFHYQAAVLSALVSNVFTIEIVEPLARRAEADLKRLGYTNVVVRAGDGYQGWRERAPFDAVIVPCAPDHVPQPLVDQLKEGGRMIIPVGPAGDQELYILRKTGNRIEKRAVLQVRFVPMTSKKG